MGPGCIARDGIVANAGAWFVLRNFATRLRLRVSPGRAGLLDRFSDSRVARLVGRGRIAGAPGYLYTCACAGVAGLGTESRQSHAHELQPTTPRPTTRHPN